LIVIVETVNRSY